MRPRNQRRNRIFEYGVLLLIAELLSVGYDAIPPATFATIVGQGLLYVGLIEVPWEKWDVCISGYKVLYKRDFKSLFLSTFEHADDMHLYYNMISFLVKGRTLEYKYGTANFALLLAIISVITSVLYVGLAILGSVMLVDKSIMSNCAIGFSGVIFALKFITTFENSGGYTYIHGFRIPTRYATWVELLAIHILVPNASFMGHFAGVLAGLLYTKTFVGTIIDTVLYLITGHEMIHGGRSRERTNYQRQSYEYYDEDPMRRFFPRNAFFDGFFGRTFRRGYRPHYEYDGY